MAQKFSIVHYHYVVANRALWLSHPSYGIVTRSCSRRSNHSGSSSASSIIMIIMIMHFALFLKIMMIIINIVLRTIKIAAILQNICDDCK